MLIKNLHTFKQINPQEIDSKNFELSATLAYLKINKGRDIYKICVSTDNHNGLAEKYNDIAVVIYAFADFYKVVVTNLLQQPEDIEDVSFIYNW